MLVRPGVLGIAAGAGLAAVAGTGYALGGAGLALQAAGLTLGVGLGIAALGFVGIAASVTLFGRRDGARAADCVIVLGTPPRADGSPSEALASRVRQAEVLFAGGQVPEVIFTGGFVRGGVSESECARQMALRDGLPADRLHVESKSEHTLENLREAQAIMDSHGWISCVISTDPYHALRASVIANELGMDASVSPARDVPSTLAGKSRAAAREVHSLMKYWNHRLARALR